MLKINLDKLTEKKHKNIKEFYTFKYNVLENQLRYHVYCLNQNTVSGSKKLTNIKFNITDKSSVTNC